jgi:hypothetical protein
MGSEAGGAIPTLLQGTQACLSTGLLQHMGVNTIIKMVAK